LRHEIVVNYGTDFSIPFRTRRAIVSYSGILQFPTSTSRTDPTAVLLARIPCRGTPLVAALGDHKGRPYDAHRGYFFRGGCDGRISIRLAKALWGNL